ncbi:MAG: tRNA pseudouridine32 synthase/23S rRNA pseudouridine746 synthase [Patiriisocius sp.]|jgi:tRNA pseudouridine32 synthase/23S rRNA pseudouridine746 synthase
MPDFTYHVPPPCDEPIDIVYVDDHVLVVSKPSGLLSVPGRFVKDCVLNRLIFDYPDSRIVHRLDLDTSGLLVLAQSKLATSELNRQFRERTIEKAYEAIVAGLVEQSEGEINLPIAPDPDNRPRQLIDDAGKAALTKFTVIARDHEDSRVALFPVTGRSHQLRIHMAAIGHPILGCDLYATPVALAASPRLLLHAAKLTIHHPKSGQPLTFESPVPF